MVRVGRAARGNNGYMSINHESSLATERVGGAFALPQEHLLAARGEQEAVARVEPLPLGRYLYICCNIASSP